MYRCCNIRGFLRFLIWLILLLAILLCFFSMKKNSANKAVSRHGEEDVFLPVIMYHSISDATPNDYIVTPKQIESDLKYLHDNGYTSVTAEELLDYVWHGGSLPQKPVLITLDDGFNNNYTNLLPLLEKYDAHAVVSVVGSYIDDNPNDGSFYPYLTWGNVNKMIKSGRFEIGNHTYDMHYMDGGRRGVKMLPCECPDDYAEAVNSDIFELQRLIDEKCGITPIIFAYPFGYCCKEIVPILKENGFLITLTCYEKPNYLSRNTDCLFELNRYNRSGLYSTVEFMKKVLSK